MKTNQQILEEASNWFIEFRAGDVDARARQEFHAWLRRSPDHIQAYLDIAATYAELPAPVTNGAIDLQVFIDKARASVDLNVVSLDVRKAANSPSPQQRHARAAGARRALSIAASVLFVALALASWFYVERETYGTDIGEQRSFALADGSTIQLNSRSRVRVRYTHAERRIDLIEGQALFQVAKNAQRPFVVHVNDTQVRAVGTQFDVYRRPSGTVVTVIEGRVAVAGSAVSGQSPSVEVPDILLIAGEQLTVSPQLATKPLAVNPNTATAWTQRQLIFDNASLSEVVEEFNRYSTRPLAIDAGDFADFHVSGAYSSTNPDSLLRFLQIQPGIRLIESDTEIRITRE
jgi:transmembrane sensor